MANVTVRRAEFLPYNCLMLRNINRPFLYYSNCLPGTLIPNPLHILEQNLLAAAVVDVRDSAVGVAGNALSGFKGALIFQKILDTGRPKQVR